MCFSILFWRAEQQWGPSTASAAPLTSSKQPQAEHSCEGHARTEQIKFKTFSLQSFLLLLLHFPTPCNRCNFSYTLFRFESWSFCFSPPLIPAGSSSLSRPKRCQERGNAPGKLLLLQSSVGNSTCLTSKILCGEGWAGKVCAGGSWEEMGSELRLGKGWRIVLVLPNIWQRVRHDSSS